MAPASLSHFQLLNCAEMATGIKAAPTPFSPFHRGICPSCWPSCRDGYAVVANGKEGVGKATDAVGREISVLLSEGRER